MRFIHFGVPFVPSARWEAKATARTTALLAKTSQKDRSDYLTLYPHWGRLKPWLSGLSFGKCWYCEAASRRAPSDVDHFRPKLAVTINRTALPDHAGYYWLAYAWWNFRLSCQRCNRPERDDDIVLRGKANEFPLRDEAHRCADPNQAYTQEEPRLLDPCNSADVALLAYGPDGEVKPVADEGTWEFERARYTIDILGLNSYNTPEYRRECWLTLQTLINAMGNGPASTAVEDRLRAHMDPKHEYSSFFRSVIGIYREKNWVEALISAY